MYAIMINIGICMWNPSVVSWLGMSLGEMYGSKYLLWCDIVANSHINVIKGIFTQKHWLHGHDMSYRTYGLCPCLALKSGLATNNHIGLLIVCLIINIFPFYFQTRICYAFYALAIHHNLLVLTHCKLMTIKPQFFANFNWNW